MTWIILGKGKSQLRFNNMSNDFFSFFVLEIKINLTFLTMNMEWKKTNFSIPIWLEFLFEELEKNLANNNSKRIFRYSFGNQTELYDAVKYCKKHELIASTNVVNVFN